MSQTPNGAEAQRIVDDLEEDIVDVDKATAEQQPEGQSKDQQGEQSAVQPEGQDGESGGGADDLSGDVPGAPEPTD
jgi:hypothetical protein